MSLSWTLLLIEAEFDSKESSLRLLSGLRLGNTTFSSSLESDWTRLFATDSFLLLVASGLTADGLTANGLIVEGLTFEGLMFDGLTVDGLIAEGLVAEGLTAKGLTDEELELSRLFAAPSSTSTSSSFGPFSMSAESTSVTHMATGATS